MLGDIVVPPEAPPPPVAINWRAAAFAVRVIRESVVFRGLFGLGGLVSFASGWTVQISAVLSVAAGVLVVGAALGVDRARAANLVLVLVGGSLVMICWAARAIGRASDRREIVATSDRAGAAPFVVAGAIGYVVPSLTGDLGPFAAGIASAALVIAGFAWYAFEMGRIRDQLCAVAREREHEPARATVVMR